MRRVQLQAGLANLASGEVRRVGHPRKGRPLMSGGGRRPGAA